MIRGTTQVHTFFMPFDLSNIRDIYVTYVQNEQEIIEKSIEDINFEHQKKAISVELSQYDTLLFHPYTLPGSDIVSIQIRLNTFDGRTMASHIMRTRVYDVLKQGVI